jgi:hypothetical protein
MVKRSRLPVLVLLFLVLGGSNAFAWFGDGWLEKLSGPGPFTGWSADVRLVCIGAPPGEADASEIASGPDAPIGWKITVPNDINRRMWLTPVGCHFLGRDRPRLELGVQYAWMSSDSDDNPLDYSDRPDVASLDKAVRMRPLLLTADVRVHRLLDLGLAIGHTSFSSPSDAFSDFGRTTFQPARVTVRPLSILSDDARLTEMVSLRFDATLFVGGFTGEDFGARPGSFNEPGELLWGWRVLIDPSTIFWRR